MDLELAGKVALVTASSKGLGRATALALSQEGARVALVANAGGPPPARALEVGDDALEAALQVDGATTRGLR